MKVTKGPTKRISRGNSARVATSSVDAGLPLDLSKETHRLLSIFASSLRQRIQEEAKRRTKKQTRAFLKRVPDAANLLRAALSVSSMREHFEHFGPIPNRDQLEASLHEMAANAYLLSNEAPWLVRSCGQTKAGRGKARAPKSISPKRYCAAVAYEVFVHSGGKEPTENSLEVAELAQQLWLHSGGESKGWGSDPREGWSPYFQSIDEAAVTAVRGECRGHFTQSIAESQ